MHSRNKTKEKSLRADVKNICQFCFESLKRAMSA